MKDIILLPFYLLKLFFLLGSYFSDLWILKNSKNFEKDLARYKGTT